MAAIFDYIATHFFGLSKEVQKPRHKLKSQAAMAKFPTQSFEWFVGHALQI